MRATPACPEEPRALQVRKQKGIPLPRRIREADDNSAQATTGQNSTTATTPGEETKGKPAIQQWT